MTSIRTKTITALALALAATAAGAHAQATGTSDFTPEKAGEWVVAARITAVDPAEKGNIVTAAGASTGLHVGVDNDTIPSLGFSYFFTDHIAAEAILGTSQHTISAVGASSSTDVYKTWVLPPVVTLQYHFAPDQRVSPYLGVGVNFMDWYSGKDENGFTVKLKNGGGTAIQGGVNVALKGHWAFNFDVKKVFYATDAKIDGGALKSHVKLDPTIASLGLAYRF